MSLIILKNRKIGDPFFGNTVLHLPFNNLTPAVGGPITVVSPSLTFIQTTVKRPGFTASLRNVAGGGLITTIPAINKQDFTVETWFNATAWNATYYATIIDTRMDTTNTVIGGFIVSLKDQGVWFSYSNGSSTVTTTGAAINPGLNVWNHIAVSRSGGFTRLFLNGVILGGVVTDNNNYSLRHAKIYTHANRATGPGTSLSGYLQDFRLTIGVGRYTSNFAVPATPLPLN